MSFFNSTTLAKDILDTQEREGFDSAILHLSSTLYDPDVCLEAKLDLEARIAIPLLRSNENESAYAKFYGVFDQYYRAQHSGELLYELDFPRITCKRAYFVHNGTMLAHSSSLLRHIEVTDDNPRDTMIFVIQCDQNFLNKAYKIGVQVVQVPGSDWVEKLSALKAICRNVDYLVWVCFPVFLSLLAKHCNNIIWWSLKFHPPITGPAKYVSRFANANLKNQFMGKEWVNYRGTTFERWGLEKKEAASTVGKIKFGAFCREELIDCPEYWGLVKAILDAVPEIYFTYCGRKPIHFPWIKQYVINPDRVIYLGWLNPVAQYIQGYRFLLDPLKMSHGHLGLEAMASGIPVLTELKNVFTKSPSGYVASLLGDGNCLNFTMRFSQREIRWLDLTFADKSDLCHKALLLGHKGTANAFAEYSKLLASKMVLCDGDALKLD